MCSRKNSENDDRFYAQNKFKEESSTTIIFLWFLENKSNIIFSANNGFLRKK